MSRENLESVQRHWEAFIAGDLDTALLGWTEDCVFEDFADMPDRATYAGHDGVIQAVEHFTEMWGDLVFAPVEFVDAGENLVIAVVSIRGRGRDSGAPLDALGVWLYEMRDRRVARSQAFTSKEHALEAAAQSS